MAPGRSTKVTPRAASRRLLYLSFALVPLLLAGAGTASAVQPSAAHVAGTAFVNITATSSVAFAPSQVTVSPGVNIDFTITQGANFDHSFVLSGLRNFSFDSSASGSNITLFFRAHAPLVNLSLGSTVGATQSATIGPLPVGTYEFVCIVATHFQSGMHGELVVANSAPGGGTSVPTIYYIVIAVVVVVVIAAVVVVLLRRRPRGPSATPPSATPPN
jgi:plastocyanin